MGLPFLGAISILLSKESVKWCAFYLPNNITNFSFFYRKKARTLN